MPATDPKSAKNLFVSTGFATARIQMARMRVFRSASNTDGTVSAAACKAAPYFHHITYSQYCAVRQFQSGKVALRPIRPARCGSYTKTSSCFYRRAKQSKQRGLTIRSTGPIAAGRHLG